MTITFTLIRHGESVDNLSRIWAGWKDSVLSNHGMNQAKALGAAMATTHFAAILTSPLQRAVMTAQTLLDAQPAPQPSLTASDLLREQHFGIAEGKPWTMKAVPHLSFADHVAKGIYISTYSRSEKFPGGESPDDLSRRAEKAVEELLLPYIWDTERDRSKNTHIAIVSHGLCIGAIMVALVKMDASGTRPSGDYYGLLNTAWARVSVEVNTEPSESVNSPLPLNVRVTDFNQHSHLNNVVRQRGGVGSAAYDQTQKDIREFFSGKREVEVQEHNESNTNE